MWDLIRSLFASQVVSRKYCYRPDPVDTRDLLISQLKGKLASSTTASDADLRQYCSPIEDQLSTGSCVGNSVVGGLEILENVQGAPFVDLSRLYVYYNARIPMGEAGKDDGCYIRYAMASLSSLGVCTEQTWPFDVGRVTVRPSWSAYRESYLHRIKGYYRIDGAGDDRCSKIEWALSNKHPVVFGVDVWQSFPDTSSATVLPQSGKFLGRHAMLLVGFNRPTRKFILRNSWGTQWGDSGYGVIDYSWLDASNCKDVWVPTCY